MNLANCGSLITSPLTGIWHRAIQPQHQQTALQTSHTRSFPSRFNEGRHLFDILYLAEDQMVALFEVQALLGSPYGMWVANPHQAWVTLNVNVTLHHIVDLTRLSQQRLIDTTVQELTGDWRGYQLRTPATSSIQPTGPPAPTQELGEALYFTPNVQGFLTASARVPTRMNLVVFPNKLDSQSRIIYTDHAGTVVHKIEG